MLLTISIPTYKRPELLFKSLSEIFRQISGLPDVAVFVADDSGGEVNRPVIEQIRQTFPQAALQVTVNQKNIGIDENIKNCISAPESEYVWLLGEDDFLTDGSVEKVVTAIKRYRPPFLFANYIYCNDAHNKFAPSPVVAETPTVRQILFDDFVSKSVWALGFIGGCVIRKADWCSQSIAKFHGSYYSHVGGIIDACHGKEIVVLGDILVLNRAENVETFTWSRNTFDVYFSFFDMLAASRLVERPALFAACWRAATSLFAVYKLSWLAAKRADGIFDLDAFRRYYLPRSDLSLPWKLLAQLIALVPRRVLYPLRHMQLKRRFRRSVL